MHERLELINGDDIAAGDRDDVLREHVERVPDVARGLDRSRVHPLGERGGGEQIAAVLRKDDAGRRRIDLVPGASDALHARCDRGRRLDLDDQIDRPHVDAELERARGDQRADAAGLEIVLDAQPLLASNRAVVRVRDLLLRQLVERRRDALGQAAAVHEDQRRAMLADQLKEPRMDRWPDRGPAIRPGDRSRAEFKRLSQSRHVLHRHLDLELEPLAVAGVDDRDRSRAVIREAAEESRDLVERPLRRGQADALQPGLPLLTQTREREALEALEREGEMRAALCGDHRVDLVDDHRLDILQCRAGRGRQHQVERLRCGDEDVRRRLCEPHAVLRRRVAGADRDGRLAERDA